jgi:hypothetical protein
VQVLSFCTATLALGAQGQQIRPVPPLSLYLEYSFPRRTMLACILIVVRCADLQSVDALLKELATAGRVLSNERQRQFVRDFATLCSTKQKALHS